MGRIGEGRGGGRVMEGGEAVWSFRSRVISYTVHFGFGSFRSLIISVPGRFDPGHFDRVVSV